MRQFSSTIYIDTKPSIAYTYPILQRSITEKKEEDRINSVRRDDRFRLSLCGCDIIVPLEHNKYPHSQQHSVSTHRMHKQEARAQVNIKCNLNLFRNVIYHMRLTTLYHMKSWVVKF